MSDSAITTGRMPPRSWPIYIVDDEQEVRSSLVFLFRTMRIDARPFGQAEDFLDELAFLEPGCVLVDLRMAAISGIELLEQMRERDCFWPAIMMSGHGDIPAAVHAVRLGAVDFLQKPFSDDDLLAALKEGFRRMPDAVSRSRRARSARSAFSMLSHREQQVFEGVIAGKTSKEIAHELQLSPRTVESYRVTLMAKLGVQRLHELFAIARALDEPL